MKSLVVEDVCMMRKLLEKLLSPFGKCDSVENGREALIKFNHAWLNDEKYDVIFLDLMIPEITGDEVLKEIRVLENNLQSNKKNNVKIIICSALSDYENVMNVLNEECDAYISKPFDRNTIYETLEKLDLVNAEDVKKVKLMTQRNNIKSSTA